MLYLKYEKINQTSGSSLIVCLPFLFQDPMLPILSEGSCNFLLDGIGADIDESRPPMKSGVKCSKSVVGHYLSSGKLRERFNSSSSGRTRFIHVVIFMVIFSKPCIHFLENIHFC